MKKILFIITCVMTFFVAAAQHIPAYTADNVMSRVSDKDTLYIVNFWATWCPPCVKELPVFDTLQNLYAEKPVKVLLVSLDFKEGYPEKLQEYISKKHVLPEVVWFNETDANIFIPKIDTSWLGSIPSTMIVQQGKPFKKFIENTVTVKEISAIANQQLGTVKK